MKLAVMSKNVKFKDIKNRLIEDKHGKGAELLTFASFSYFSASHARTLRVALAPS